MPIERRRLAFGPDEIVEAAIGYCHCAGIAVPARRRCIPAVTDDARARVRLHFPEEFRSGGWLILLDDRQMIGALILHCRVRHVPLPRGGVKSLQRAGEGLALLVRVDHGRARPPRPVAA